MRKPVAGAPRPRSGLRKQTAVERPLLERILETPHLAEVVPQLRPDVLYGVIERCGLEDSGELVALATPAQLAGVFDLDLWRAHEPGLDEHFDAERFGVWLEVLLESGPEVAAAAVAAMDARLVSGALAQHVLVFDIAAGVARSEGVLNFDVGGFRVVASRPDAWDAIVAVLTALHAEHEVSFQRVMRGCRSLSNSTFEVDGLDDLFTARQQVLHDMALDRERRREQQGFVTPAQARAFLQLSRVPFKKPSGRADAALADPVARAYFRAVEAPAAVPVAASHPDAVAAVVGVLLDAQILPAAPRALLEAPEGHTERIARIRALMLFLSEHHPVAYARRTEELAYLVNTVAVGCPIQGRPLTVEEASDAAVAVCNLGLENWPDSGPLPDTFLTDHDLVSVFQAGWASLHLKVCMYTATELIGVLNHLKSGDRETQAGITTLRMELRKHSKVGAPWLAKGAMDVIASLDMTAWASLLTLVDECPVIHAGMGASRRAGTRTVSASAFEFISENSQIAAVKEFLQGLPEMLGP